jgi:hypothetical protein
MIYYSNIRPSSTSSLFGSEWILLAEWVHAGSLVLWLTQATHFASNLAVACKLDKTAEGSEMKESKVSRC